MPIESLPKAVRVGQFAQRAKDRPDQLRIIHVGRDRHQTANIDIRQAAAARSSGATSWGVTPYFDGSAATLTSIMMGTGAGAAAAIARRRRSESIAWSIAKVPSAALTLLV